MTPHVMMSGIRRVNPPFHNATINHFESQGESWVFAEVSDASFQFFPVVHVRLRDSRIQECYYRLYVNAYAFAEVDNAFS
jgi:hypothetical protein